MTAVGPPPVVVLHDLRKSFPAGDGSKLEVLDIGHLVLPAATCTVLRGRSGSGKTTLLNLIAGVALPSAGTVRIDDTDVFALSEAGRDRFRARNIGYVFQSFNLLAAFSAIENVMLAMSFASVVPRRLQHQRAADLLGRLGLTERLMHKPHHLSRGEQQRVAIARAMANDPPLILADEPCASLDAGNAGKVLATFLSICREDGRTLLMASHDEAARGAADQVLDMAQLNRTEGHGTLAMAGA